MSQIDDLVKAFLSEKVIAVVGVSDRQEGAANLSYANFKARGYTVYGVNPRISAYKGEPCYPDLKSLPQKAGAVVLVTPPAVTEQYVEQCVETGVKNVWMHNMAGTSGKMAAETSSVSAKAVQTCRANGISVIPGSCPNQFIGDFGHKTMCVMWKMFGMMKIEV
jgi:uncharacterized protein